MTELSIDKGQRLLYPMALLFGIGDVVMSWPVAEHIVSAMFHPFVVVFTLVGFCMDHNHCNLCLHDLS